MNGLYLICVIIFIISINSGSVFAASVNGCTKAKCPYYPEPPANVTFFPHDTDCSRYCMCDWYSTVHDMACPSGLHWNAKLDTCDWPANAGCDGPTATSPSSTTSTTTPTPTPTSTTTTTNTTPGPLPTDIPVEGCLNSRCPYFPEPPANVTFFPHDTDCSRYCMCDWYSTVHDMACPSGLHWNPKLDTCDWPADAGCDGSSVTSPSSTTSTTTPTPTPTSTTTTTNTTPGPLPTDIPVEGCLNSRCPYFPEPPANVTFFPHDTDCSRYCMCDWYSTVHDMACPSGLHWNPKLDTCDWPADAGCDGSSVTSPSSTTSTTTPTPTTTSTTTTTNTTPGPLPTDIPVEGCLNSRCPYFPEPPANVTFFPHDTDCSRYCMCDWYSTVHDMACPSGLHWNPKLDTCDWPADAGCDGSSVTSPSSTTSTTTPTPTPTSTTTTTNTTPGPLPTDIPVEGCLNSRCPYFPEPPANVTFFPHDTDCSRYCMCDWYSTVHDMACPSGLHWNPKLDTCDWPADAGCDGSSVTSPSSTTSTTTPTPTPTSTTTTTNTTPGPLPTDIPVEGCLNSRCPYFPEPPANVTFFPHDTDCSRYCMCDWYSTVHDMACPSGLHWNPKLDTCDWPADAGCDGSSVTSPSSTTSTTTPTPTPTSTTTTTNTTPGPLPTDIPVEGCLNSRCPYFPEPPANVTFFPHDTDCSRYCMCDWYSTVHDMACPSGLHWNAKLDTCDWPADAGCDGSSVTSPSSTTSTTTPTPTPTSTTTTTNTTPGPLPTDIPVEGCLNSRCPYFPEPPANVTFFPHDTDCSRYCMCDWYSTVHDMACPSGLHWNPKLDTCDWPADAGCDGSSVTSPSSTTSTTTPTPTPTSTTTTTNTTPGPLPTDIPVEGCLNSRCPYFPEPPANVTFFPHDTDCSRYCMCDWYSTVHDMACPSGLHWNPKLDTCDWPADAGCDGSSVTSPSSTTSTTTPTPTPTSTTTTTTTITTPDPGPTEIPVSGCTNSRCPYFPEPPANVTFFPHDSDCGRYCMCDWFSSVHDMPCPDGLHWNAVLDTCDWPRSAGCDTTSDARIVADVADIVAIATTGCLNAKCPLYQAPPAKVTFFPHDSDCTRYCMCDWYGQAHNMLCGKDLRWNRGLNTCDWANHAEC